MSVPRLDRIEPGSLVTLQLDWSGPGWLPDVALFLGIEGKGDEREAKFLQVDPRGRPYEWKAYRHNGRWVYGYPADPLRVIDVADGLTSCPADGYFSVPTGLAYGSRR